MANEQHWTGQAIFNNTDERDRYVEVLRDFIDAREHVLPIERPGYAAGIEKRANIHMDPDQGPGFVWSCQIPDSADPLYMEAQLFVANEILANAVDGNQSTGSLPT
jgi:hypothetical protein